MNNTDAWLVYDLRSRLRSFKFGVSIKQADKTSGLANLVTSRKMAKTNP